MRRISWNNGIIDNNNDQKDTNLLGMRATFSPNIIKNLNIELLKISQWGKTDNHEIFNDFFNALIGNTNEGKHSSTNSMAGIGFSYQPENYIYPFNIYGQFIGEDESGNLPNCFVGKRNEFIIYDLDFRFQQLIRAKRLLDAVTRHRGVV